MTEGYHISKKETYSGESGSSKTTDVDEYALKLVPELPVDRLPGYVGTVDDDGHGDLGGATGLVDGGGIPQLVRYFRPFLE